VKMVKRTKKVIVTVTRQDGKQTISVVDDKTARHLENQCLSGHGDIAIVNVEPAK